MSSALQMHDPLTLEAFLAWDAPPGVPWQLIDGVPVAMAPASPIHASIQSELARLLGNHLAEQGGPCRIYTNPGVRLGVDTDHNFRIPDLGVTCTPLIQGDPALPEPLLLVEILSPSNPRETWINVWAYTTIPSIQEILIVRSDVIGAQVLRRNPDGSWPAVPSEAGPSILELQSIGLRIAPNAPYVGTWLAEHAA